MLSYFCPFDCRMPFAQGWLEHLKKWQFTNKFFIWHVTNSWVSAERLYSCSYKDGALTNLYVITDALINWKKRVVPKNLLFHKFTKSSDGLKTFCIQSVSQPSRIHTMIHSWVQSSFLNLIDVYIENDVQPGQSTFVMLQIVVFLQIKLLKPTMVDLNQVVYSLILLFSN